MSFEAHKFDPNTKRYFESLSVNQTRQKINQNYICFTLTLGVLRFFYKLRNVGNKNQYHLPAMIQPTVIDKLKELFVVQGFSKFQLRIFIL